MGKFTNNVLAGESIHAETDGLLFSSPTIYARNNPVNGKGAAIAALVNGKGAGIWAVSENGKGIHAETHNPDDLPAIEAVNKNNDGKGSAIYANAENNGIGIHSTSKNREAIYAETKSNGGHPAIYANNRGEGNGSAITAHCFNQSENGTGGNGIEAQSGRGIGLKAVSFGVSLPAIHATNMNRKYKKRNELDKASAIYAENLGTAPTIYAKSALGKTAGFFEGDVEITKILYVKGIDVIDIIEKYEKRITALEKMYEDHKAGIDALPKV